MTILLLIVAILVLIFGFVVVFGAPYVPSLRKEVRGAFVELYPLTKQDTVVDLGSGDGSVLLEASKREAVCIGIELNPLLVLISRLRIGKYGHVMLGNMWALELPAGTTLVYAFTVSRDTKRLTHYMQKEANRLNKSLVLMTFGAGLPKQTPVKVLKAHSLYEFMPLQHA